MNANYHKLELENINDGAIPELFDHAWQKVIDDIADVNKPAKSKRTITIKIEVAPSEERGHGAIFTSVGIKLPSPEATQGLLFLQIENGRIESYVTTPKQDGLFPDDQDGEILDIKQGEK